MVTTLSELSNSSPWKLRIGETCSLEMVYMYLEKGETAQPTPFLILDVLDCKRLQNQVGLSTEQPFPSAVLDLCSHMQVCTVSFVPAASLLSQALQFLHPPGAGRNQGQQDNLA